MTAGAFARLEYRVVARHAQEYMERTREEAPVFGRLFTVSTAPAITAWPKYSFG